MTLTEHERELIKRGYEKNLVRPVEQWQTILVGLTPEEAAARIFGDLHCYTADRRRGMVYERRQGFLQDVQNLANVLRAYASAANSSTTSED